MCRSLSFWAKQARMPLPAALDCRSNTELFHRASPLLITIRRSQVRHTVDLKIAVGDWGRFPMKTAAEYRAMAEECFNGLTRPTIMPFARAI